MTAKPVIKKETGRIRLIAFISGLLLVFGFAAGLPLPCSGMEALTHQELGELSGSTGISMAFSSPTTVKASFTALTFGDTDGWGGTTSTAGDRNAGWLVLVGNGTNTAVVNVEVPGGTQLDISVGTTGAAACLPAGGAPYAGLSIPAETSFFTFSLTDTNIVMTTPETINIGLSPNAYSAGDVMGYMLAENVAINKASMKSTCYIWAH